MPTRRRPLPIGIQTFAKLREDGAYYVDKTGLAIDLIESGACLFLSRPRRFGKSLLLDTIKELFEANRPLFTGLAAETRWDWMQRRARHLPWLHRHMVRAPACRCIGSASSSAEQRATSWASRSRRCADLLRARPESGLTGSASPYIDRRYCPPTSNSALVICPSEHTRTASISTSNTFALSITAC